MMPAPLIHREERDFPGQGRPGADKRHVAFEYIDQLRKLVDAKPAEEAANPGDSGVVLLLVDAVARPRAGIAEKLPPVEFPVYAIVPADMHRPQFEHGKGSLALTDSRLPEEYWPRTRDLDQERGRQDQRREKGEGKASHRQIEGPLAEPKIPVCRSR
jgi:hypothetical protein